MSLTAEKTGSIAFDNSYARLPDRFYARLAPARVRSPSLIRLNRGLARLLGLDEKFLASPAGLAMLSGNAVPDGAQPIAMAYAGHQFGQFVPQLGDGRAILLGEIVGADGLRRDIQLKGSGRTPFSRGGDGRAAVGPVLREYVVSEAMHALGVPTTRALAAVATGEPVYRETELPGAVLTRVAQSHIRVGTFQYFASRGDVEALRLLADHVIDRHYPDCADAPNRHEALLEAVVARQAELIAQWLSLGFIHGVMNTDNMSIAGETIDFGPCAFMDQFSHDKVYSSIDHMGRYAYSSQPGIGQWNLAQFAQCLLPLIDENPTRALEAAQQRIDAYGPLFEAQLLQRFAAKLGIPDPVPGDLALVQSLLSAMQAGSADFTLTFRLLAGAVDPAADPEQGPRALFEEPAAFEAWLEGWRQRLAGQPRKPEAIAEAIRAVNPRFIPRNHLVEEAIAAAVDEGDYGPFEILCGIVCDPYAEQPGWDRYARPPTPEQEVQRTFCGT